MVLQQTIINNIVHINWPVIWYAGFESDVYIRYIS